jgi:hypothetical protein
MFPEMEGGSGYSNFPIVTTSPGSHRVELLNSMNALPEWLQSHRDFFLFWLFFLSWVQRGPQMRPLALADFFSVESANGMLRLWMGWDTGLFFPFLQGTISLGTEEFSCKVRLTTRLLLGGDFYVWHRRLCRPSARQ